MKSELLVPVGNMQMCLAAIHHGADAVYFGVPEFNARGRSADFSLDELREMIELCHLYGVRVNLALNVVIFEQELAQVVKLLESIIPLGPDAFIVQDLGLAQLIRSMAPHQRLHASTQMTVTNADAIKFLDDLRIERFVLARENSLQDIRAIRERTDKELEVFVHGALCVAYSGQCFTSESLGGRSANRGQCAQSCRLEYELYVDDEKKDMGEKKYLVSPKDLMGIEEVGALRDLGVNSFKIEGRLKTPEYVAAAARNYRQVLDGESLDLSRRAGEMASTYSRGFFTGWLHGVDHQRLVDATFSAHRGQEIGRVKEVRGRLVLLESSSVIEAGMGLLFVGKKELGSKVFSSKNKGSLIEVELLQKNLQLNVGMKVYLNSDEKLNRQLQKGWQSREFQKRIPLKLNIEGELNTALKLRATDPEGRIVEVCTEGVLTPAQTQGLSEDGPLSELFHLGGSVYKIESYEILLAKDLFIHQRELKNLRQKMVEKLNQLRIQVPSHSLRPISLPHRVAAQETLTKLNILLRSKKQVEGFKNAFEQGLFKGLQGQLGEVILDFEFGKDYLESVQIIKALGIRVAIATTRILKPGEYHHLKMIIRCGPDKILARNLGAIEFLQRECTIALSADFSLNVANSLSAAYLLNKGLESVTLSYDLNQAQLLELISHSDGPKLEVTLHQYMPEFHMEHCVFAAFLSQGHSFRDCGKPCERHEVKLKDPYGNWHHLKADQECRNTFFKATPQSASFLIHDLQKLGVGAVRLEALNESGQELNQKILVYLKLLTGQMSPQESMDQLKVVETYGLGKGQLARHDTYQDRKK